MPESRRISTPWRYITKALGHIIKWSQHTEVLSYHTAWWTQGPNGRHPDNLITIIFNTGSKPWSIHSFLFFKNKRTTSLWGTAVNHLSLGQKQTLSRITTFLFFFLNYLYDVLLKDDNKDDMFSTMPFVVHIRRSIWIGIGSPMFWVLKRQAVAPCLQSLC